MANAVPSDKLTDLQKNAQTTDTFVNSDDLTVTARPTPTDPSGKVLKTLAGINADVELALQRIGVQYSDPITDWTALTEITAFEAHRYPATTGDIYIPTAPLPFTTGATFDSGNWTLLQGVTTASLDSTLEAQNAIVSKTLGEAVADTTAYEGKRVRISDRDNELFEYKTGQTPNAYNIVSCTGAPTLSLVLEEYDGISVIAFGAKGNSTGFGLGNDDTGALQAALDSVFDVKFPGSGTGGEAIAAIGYRITSSLELKHVKRITGSGGINSFYYKTMARIIPDGNFPVFTNQSGFAGAYEIEGFLAVWSENTTPTIPTGNDQKYLFYFTDRGDGLSNQYYTLRNCEVNGAWGVYYDDTDAYKGIVQRVIGRYCKNGFYKRLGTMMKFDTCSNSLGEQGFFFENTVSNSLINCSADSNDPVTGVTNGNSVNYFFACTSMTISGWDVEGNNISGNQISYMNFRDTDATVIGMAGLANSMSCTTGEWITWIRATGSTSLQLSGFNPKSITPATDLSFTGDAGECSTVRADGGAKIVLLGGNATAPTGGTPDSRYSMRGNGGSIYNLGASSDELTSGVKFDCIDNLTTMNFLQLANIPLSAGTTTKTQLEAYEEGTFTASLRAGGVEWGTVNAAYTLIGRLVTINLSFDNQQFSAGPSGLFTITGLPFTSINDGNKKASGSVTYRETGSGVTNSVNCFIDNNSTTIDFIESTSSGQSANVNAEQLFAFNGSSGNYMTLAVSYLI